MARLADAIEWIALNDDAGAPYAMDERELAGQLTIVLVADVWRLPASEIARRVVKVRQRIEESEADALLLAAEDEAAIAAEADGID